MNTAKYFFCLLSLCFFLSHNQILAQQNTINLNVGSVFIDGDINSKLKDGGTIGVGYSRDIYRFISLESSYFYARAKGIEVIPATFPFKTMSDPLDWIPNFSTTIHSINVGLGLNKTLSDRLKFKFHYNIGLLTYDTHINLLNENNESYAEAIAEALEEGEFPERGFDYGPLEGLLDDSYETPSSKAAGSFRLGDETQVYLTHTIGLSFGYQCTQRVSLGIGWEMTIIGNDYIDGLKFRTAEDETNNDDLLHRWSVICDYHF